MNNNSDSNDREKRTRTATTGTTNRKTKEEDPARELAEGAEREEDKEEGPDDAAVGRGALRDAEGDLRPEEAEERERKEVEQLAGVGAQREERVLAAVRGAVRKEVASALRRRRQEEEHRPHWCVLFAVVRWVRKHGRQVQGSGGRCKRAEAIKRRRA